MTQSRSLYLVAFAIFLSTVAAFLYLVGSFIAMDFNPFYWDSVLRFIVGATFAGAAVMGIADRSRG